MKTILVAVLLLIHPVVPQVDMWKNEMNMWSVGYMQGMKAAYTAIATQTGGAYIKKQMIIDSLNIRNSLINGYK